MTERPFQIKVGRETVNRHWFVVSCRQCPKSDPWFRLAASINSAVRLAMQHVPDCPAVIAAADQLLDDILHLPTYRLLHMFIPGMGLIPLWGCTDCGRIAADQDEHTARHLDAREREYRHG